jgi:hypothetical protein
MFWIRAQSAIFGLGEGMYKRMEKIAFSSKYYPGNYIKEEAMKGA